MISCRGCRYYVGSVIYGGLCRYYDANGKFVDHTSPFDGRSTRTFVPAPGNPGSFRPSIDTMRAATGPCGPDAVLRESGLMERVFLFFGAVQDPSGAAR